MLVDDAPPVAACLDVLRVAGEEGAPRCIKLPNGDIRIRREEYERWLNSHEEAA